MQTFKFIINEPTCSLNELIREYSNHHARKREQERWDWMLQEVRMKSKLFKGNKEALPPGYKMIVTRLNNRFLDYDNMAGGIKFLLDGMKHAGIIVDDNPEFISELVLRQEKVKRVEAKTIIELVPGEEKT